MVKIKSLLTYSIILFTASCHTSHSQNSNSFLEIVKIVETNHINPISLNDDLSVKIFETYLNKIDPSKIIFTENDIKILQSYRKLLDNEFQNGSIRFLSLTVSILKKRIEKLEKYAFSKLGHILNINQSEKIDLKKIASYYSLNEKQAYERWNLLIKKQFLEELYIVDISHTGFTKAKKKEIALQKTNSFYHNYFNELKNLSTEKLFSLLVNSYLFINDYQSGYFSYEAKQEWNQAYNRSFVGVGIYIETTINYPIIKNVVMGGSAWHSKKIHAGDKLTHVSLNGEDYINLAGKPIKEVLNYLKGKEGTPISIRIKTNKNLIETIVLTRSRIDLPKTMSFILENTSSGFKTGYIRLPRFYRDDLGSAEHVLTELKNLNSLDVKNLIFDLRNNKGGSVYEAVKIIGYFLNGGPIMHARYANGDQRTFSDEDETAHYTGKLIILVNTNSGSASELFAGTIQDYGRGIIVGSQTFGKGTIQRFFDVIVKPNNLKEGDVKLTIGTFYTGKGRTTQYNGIKPDIAIPTKMMYLKTGERAVENSLRFENLQTYQGDRTKADSFNINQLNSLCNARIEINPFFKCIKQYALNKKNIQRLEEISLIYEEFRDSKMEFSQDNCITELNNTSLFKAKMTSNNSFSAEIKKSWEALLEKDQYLFEGLLIMHDYEKEGMVLTYKK
ncbi:MAG: carboxy terminal-processing peptidase [Crocinitomicaceae bacterium]